MSERDQAALRADQLRLFGHALSQPLTMLGLAIAGMGRYRSLMPAAPTAAEFAHDLDGLRHAFERLTSVVSQMRPVDDPAADPIATK